MPGYQLKYLFRADYSNGEALLQTPEDRSTKYPGRSAFADVEHERLVRFALLGPDLRVEVDLRDGRFILNGAAMIDPELEVDRARVKTPLRLIYFRRVTQDMELEVGTPEKVASSKVSYWIGWQGNDAEGNNVQRQIEVW